MRKSLDQFILSDWIEARESMSKSDFGQLRNLAMRAGIEVPACVRSSRKPKIVFRFPEVGDTDRFQRLQNLDRLEQFHRELIEWGHKVEAQLKAQVLTNRLKKRPGNYIRLADSIRHIIRLDKTYHREPRSIGFTFARHGIYFAKGAYRGHGGFVGSRWTDKYGTLKQTARSSLGEMYEGNYTPVDWFNPVIDDHIKELQDIAAGYCADMTVDLTHIYLH